MSIYTKRFIVACALLCMHHLALAGTPEEDAAAAQAARLLQQEQQRQLQLEQERDALRLQTTPSVEGVEPVVPKQLDIDPNQCLQIDQITLSGVKLLSVDEQLELTAPYLHQCLTLNDINKLLASLTNTYFDRGYVTSRAYIPAQDLSDGELELVVIEGVIEGFKSEKISPLNLQMAFPTDVGEVLNLRDLEQGIEQLNRLDSKEASMKLVPGEDPGQTLIDIDDAATAQPWRISGSLDNSGQETTGERQLGVSVSYDNLFGLADYVSFSRQTDIDSSNKLGSSSRSLHYDFPYGYWNFDFDFSEFDYHNEIKGDIQDFMSSGESESQSIRISRLWYRDQQNKLGTRLSFKRKNNLNFVEDTLLDTSSRVLASANFDLWFQQNIERGVWGVTLGLDQGLDAFGAENDDGKDPALPRAEFSKLRLSSNFSKALELWTQNLNYSVSMQSQTSTDTLYAAEQLSIGSQYSVRGFKESGLSGNKGVYVRQEISTYLPQGPEWLHKNLGVMQIALGLDWGQVRDLTPGRDKYSALSGWGLSLRNSGGLFNFSLELAKAINPPEFLEIENYDLYFSLRYTYKPEA